MRYIKIIAFSFLIGSLSFAGDKVVLKKPPESLKKYYPPASKNFEFLSNMHSMSTSFYGINLNINEGNWNKALEWAEKLKETYVKTSEMVPEWKDYFKPKLANDLIKAVKSKNVDRVLEASKKLGQTCVKCHQDNEMAVKLVYHFPSFETIKLEDPVEFTELGTGKYMEEMTNSMKALRIYLMQNEPEKVQEAGTNFVERARGLRTMCSKCHTNKLSEEVIVGKELETALARIEELISMEKPNRDEIFKALGKVGMSCTKCHNVHLIPSKVQGAFEK